MIKGLDAIFIYYLFICLFTFLKGRTLWRNWRYLTKLDKLRDTLGMGRTPRKNGASLTS